jgi:hypothetical protein
MDPLAAQTLLGLATNLVSSAVWDVIRDPAFGGDFQPDPADEYEEVVGAAVDELAPLLQRVSAEAVDVTEDFLRSPEVRAIVSTMYRTRAEDRSATQLELRQAFAAAWGTRARELAPQLDAYGLFDALVRGSEVVLEGAIRDGVLGAHESLSARRHQETVERLEAIKSAVTGFASSPERDLEEIEKFERSLRSELAHRSERINPPSVRGEREVPMDAIYVNPSFGAAGRRLELRDLIPQAHRLVVLGSPGAGKSTFARRLCLAVARGDLPVTAGAKGLIIFLELRTYARETAEQPASLQAWLTTYIETRLGMAVPERALETLLGLGRLGVVFDGLDELPQVGRRREIRDDIDSFARNHPLAPVIVTSRLVGYEHASMPAPFQTSHLQDFDDSQVEEYAHKWFRYQALDKDEAHLDQAKTNAETFLIESSVAARDLRANPLMLGLMCVLYRGQGYIPRHRPELYGQCATYLFETWDKHRGIEVVRPVEDLLRPALRHLAAWIYSNAGLQDGVTAQAAIRRTTRFLQEQRFADAVRAERAARDFIEFCRGRAWVFSDVGADALDQDLFQFTHRTFLEFFAAEQLLNDLETTDGLYSVLSPKIKRGDWEVVTELAVHMKQMQKLGSADDIAERLLAKDLTPAQTRRVLAFLGRMLRNVAFRPPTLELIVNAVMDAVTDAARRRGDSHAKSATKTYEDLLRVGSLLFACDFANRETVKECMADYIDGLLDSADALAREVGRGWLYAGELVAEMVRESIHRDQYDYWVAQLATLRRERVQKARNSASDPRMFALEELNAGDESPAATVMQAGPLPLFMRWNPLILPRVTRTSIFDRAMRHQVDEELAADAIDALLRAKRPWFTGYEIAAVLTGQDAIWSADGVGPEFELQALLVCATVEPVLDSHPEYAAAQTQLLDSLEGEELEEPPEPSVLYHLTLARTGRAEADELGELLAPRVGRDQVLDALIGWGSGGLSFVSRQ